MQPRPELTPLTIDGDLRRGGWKATGLLEGDTDAVSQGLNWLIDGKSLAEWVDPSWREALNVHILADPDFRFDRYSSQARFEAGTVDNFLSGEDIQDISFAVVGSPSNSHEATSWNFGEAIEHILQHHCNYIYDATGAAGSPSGVVISTDIDTVNSTSFEVFIVSKSTNMWRTLQQVAAGEFYRIWCDRYNGINYRQDPPFVSPQPAAKGTLTAEHIRGTVRVKFNNSKPGERVGQVQLSAVANASTYYNATYPAQRNHGRIERQTNGIWAQSQARADTLAERKYRWLTRSYTLEVPVDPGLILFGDDGRGLDLGDRLLMTYDGPTQDAITGAGVHLNLSAQSLFVYGASIRSDPGRRQAQGTLILEHDNA